MCENGCHYAQSLGWAAPDQTAQPTDDAVGVEFQGIAPRRSAHRRGRQSALAQRMVDLIQHFAPLGSARAEGDAERNRDFVAHLDPVWPSHGEMQPVARSHLENVGFAL